MTHRQEETPVSEVVLVWAENKIRFEVEKKNVKSNWTKSFLSNSLSLLEFERANKKWDISIRTINTNTHTHMAYTRCTLAFWLFYQIGVLNVQCSTNKHLLQKTPDNIIDEILIELLVSFVVCMFFFFSSLCWTLIDQLHSCSVSMKECTLHKWLHLTC